MDFVIYWISPTISILIVMACFYKIRSLTKENKYFSTKHLEYISIIGKLEQETKELNAENNLLVEEKLSLFKTNKELEDRLKFINALTTEEIKCYERKSCDDG